ncbi:MAG: MmcQ/YjbR family DNA-binding protein [Bacteroidales bacterium]|nr:MmcQ/YjbR family DNA-binding protein [Bacteroidales bacterium]
MMYDFIQEYCLSKKGAKEDYKQEWDAIRYTVCGKMFALIGNDNSGKSIISVKHTPEYGEQLREKYPEIVEGYYLNKTHWSSMDLSGNVPEEILKQMLDCSYHLVFHSLSKKVQTEILNQ